MDRHPNTSPLITKLSASRLARDPSARATPRQVGRKRRKQGRPDSPAPDHVLPLARASSPSLPQINIHPLITPSPAQQPKPRPARNTASSKASRKCRKRGRPKKRNRCVTAQYQRRHNPHRLRRVEVVNLFAADRFASKTGRRLATFITIRWALTDRGEGDIRRRWTVLLNAFRIWASRQGVELAHIWVHENPPRDEPSFNTHLLANIPTDLREAAAAWLVKQLAGSAGAVDVQLRVAPGWNKPDDRVSYMAKGTDYATAVKFRLIRKHGWDFNQGFIPFQRSGSSRNINARARHAEGFCDQYARASSRLLSENIGLAA
jgi:hypothetical protein